MRHWNVKFKEYSKETRNDQIKGQAGRSREREREREREEEIDKSSKVL